LNLNTCLLFTAPCAAVLPPSRRGSC